MYRVRVTIAARRFAGLGYEDPSKRLFIVEQKLFNLFWVEKEVVYSEFAARKRLAELREKEEVLETTGFQDYILEDE